MEDDRETFEANAILRDRELTPDEVQWMHDQAEKLEAARLRLEAEVAQHEGDPEDTPAANLQQSADAVIWAKEFMALFGHRLAEIDEALMIGWFANAILAGWDQGRARLLEEQAGSPGELLILNATDEPVQYRVLVQDESPLDDLERTLATAEEVGIGPSGEAPPAEPRFGERLRLLASGEDLYDSLSQLADAIDQDAEALDAEAEERGARAARASLRRQTEVEERGLDGPRHGERLRRWLASTESFMIDQFVDEAGRIADEIDKDADRGMLLVEMSEEIARGRADVEEAVERLRYSVATPPQSSSGWMAGAEDVVGAEELLVELDRIFGEPSRHAPESKRERTERLRGRPIDEDGAIQFEHEPAHDCREPLIGDELARVIDATPWPELTGDEDASAFVERLEHESAADRRERQSARFEDRDGKVEGVDR